MTHVCDVLHECTYLVYKPCSFLSTHCISSLCVCIPYTCKLQLCLVNKQMTASVCLFVCLYSVYLKLNCSTFLVSGITSGQAVSGERRLD